MGRRIYACLADRLAAKKLRSHEEYMQDKKAYHARAQAWRRKNPLKGMLFSARRRARDAGVPFNLAVEDLIMPEVCPVLGIKLAASVSGTRSPSPCSPSLDRFIPSLGYVKGNVAIISHFANTIKSTATAEQVMAVANWMKNKTALTSIVGSSPHSRD